MSLQRAIRCATTSLNTSIQINNQQICLASGQTGENMPRTTLSHFYYSQCFLFLILRVDLLFCTVAPPSTPRSRLLFQIQSWPISVLIKSEMKKSTTVCHYLFKLTKSSSLNMADKSFGINGLFKKSKEFWPTLSPSTAVEFVLYFKHIFKQRATTVQHLGDSAVFNGTDRRILPLCLCFWWWGKPEHQEETSMSIGRTCKFLSSSTNLTSWLNWVIPSQLLFYERNQSA